MPNDLIIRIAGEGGEGVISSGDFLMQAAARLGVEVVTFKTFPSEIKGGYALSQVRVSEEPILSQGDSFNILVAFNGEAYAVNKKSLTPGTVLVYDYPGGDFEPEEHPGVHKYPVPMSKIAKDVLTSYISKNMVALGAVAELFGIGMESLKSSIHDKFIKKGMEMVETNYKAIDAGADYVRKNLKKTDPFMFPTTRPRKDTIILEGNQAVALGALTAGCRFFSCYPITPATSIANYLTELMLQVNGYVYQAEDEIASIGNCVGASFAGVKTMTATSGPGLDLMSELIGLAVMAELPLVIVDVQRGGPSTGMPTKHDQSDLFAACFGSHGDTPKIVLASSDVEENFYMTIEAFNLAEQYQTPVILLTDASLAIRVEAIPTPDPSKIKIVNRTVYQGSIEEGEKFQRYKVTESGVSPIGVPGTFGAAYAATGLEHSEDSGPRTNPETRTMMTEKRWRKIANLENEWKPVEREGDSDADVGIISWGLTQSVVKEAVQRLRAKGLKVAALYPKMLWPLPVKAIESFSASVNKVLVPEANYQGQLAELISAKTSVKPVKFNVFRGEPFIPAEIVKKVEELYELEKAGV
ncbi:MAG: 2-oxoacid:acceptor oxidoreductase subunit alpha [Nitrospirae bacterium]|nr:2-oxoacid:acceptor oxidoreductase subunit alpha [Nitrospirota bacterium]